MAITPPTLIADNEGESWDTTTTPKTTAAFNSAIGDVWVTGGLSEASNGTVSTPTNTGTAQTFTARGSVTTANYCGTWAWSTVVANTLTTQTISAARTGGTVKYGLNCVRFSGSDGIGAVPAGEAETDNTAPSLSITTTGDNSAIVVFMADFDAIDGASRTWRTVNSITPTAGNGYELTYFRNASNYTVYVGYYPDAGAAGAKTVGLTAPTTGKFSIVAVEVLGTTTVATAAGNAPTPPPALPFTVPGLRPVARALQLLGDASGEQFPRPEDTATAVDLVTLMAAVPLDDAPSGADAAVVAAAVPLSDIAAALDADDLTAVVSTPLADTVASDDSLSVQVAATTSPDQSLPRVPVVAVAPRAAAGQLYGDATTPQGNLSVTLDDTGTATDSVTAAVAAPLAETAAGADDLAVAAAFTVTETGTAADLLAVVVTPPSDPFQAIPLIAWMFASPKASSQQNVGDTTSGLITLTDTASGSDSLTAVPAVPLPETASGTDALTGIATAPLPETATGDDAVVALVAAPLAETATTADSLSVQVADQADQNQFKSAAPPMAISPRHAAAQTLGSAAGPDQFNITLTESVTADESLAITVTITLADTAAAVEVLAPVAGPLLTELVSAADSLAIAVVLGLTESSTAVDNLFIGGSGIQGNVRPRGDRSSSGNAYPRGSRAIIGSGG